VLPRPRLALPTIQGLRGLGVEMKQWQKIVVGAAASTRQISKRFNGERVRLAGSGDTLTTAATMMRMSS